MSFQISYKILNAEPQSTNLDPFLRDIIAYIESTAVNGALLIKMAFFMEASTPDLFRAAKTYIGEALRRHLGEQTPALVFIAQAPITGSFYAVELTLVASSSDGLNILFKSLDQTNYTLVEAGDSRWLFLGLDNHHTQERNFDSLVNSTFSMASKILEVENMSFKNVIRQWNYIENITSTTLRQTGEYQYYQIFNDTRALFYENNNLKSDFPAATGIGCDSGGFVLELIALNSPTQFQSISIKSQVQKNAYEYSKGVLIGDTTHPVSKQAPLFERAKMVLFKNDAIIYISGTAAISGEKSIEIPDVEYQTEATIKNIFELVNDNNFRLNNIHKKVKNMYPSYVRAYVKNKAHNTLVDKICRKHFKDTPLLLVQSEVCRDELLVEIEAAFHCQFIS